MKFSLKLQPTAIPALELALKRFDPTFGIEMNPFAECPFCTARELPAFDDTDVLWFKDAEKLFCPEIEKGSRLVINDEAVT
jgi:hypothetical protein